MADAPKFTEAQIRDGIFTQYLAKFPRPGLEQEEFVESQCAYFGIDERKCRRIMGDAQSSHEAQFRTGISTSSQAVGKAMGFCAAEVLETLRDSMRAVRKRPVMVGGKILEDAEGKPVFIEQPDHANRISACKEVAKILGLNAPKELHIEATHEHKHSIDDADLLREFASVAAAAGLTFIDAGYEVVAGDAGADAPDHQPVQDRPSGKGLLRLADNDDGND